MDRKTLRQAKLRELAGFQICGGFEDNLYRLTRIAGELLAAGRVSLMLLDSGHGKGSRLKLAALYGELPEAAWKEEPASGQGIAGQVLASGVSVRVNRISRSAWKSTARRPDDAGAFDSRFAQMALTLEGSANAYTVTALSAHDPDKVAKMLAKGFYKELRHCGFTPNQIIHAAGEIISELTGSLNRHARRMERGR
jgi:L-methionine (R)-S-oxide reductase